MFPKRRDSAFDQPMDRSGGLDGASPGYPVIGEHSWEGLVGLARSDHVNAPAQLSA